MHESISKMYNDFYASGNNQVELITELRNKIAKLEAAMEDTEAQIVRSIQKTDIAQVEGKTIKLVKMKNLEETEKGSVIAVINYGRDIYAAIEITDREITLAEEVEELDKQVSDLRAELRSKEYEIERLEKNADIALWEERWELQKNEIVELKAKLLETDKEKSSLQAELKELRGKKPWWKFWSSR